MKIPTIETIHFLPPNFTNKNNHEPFTKDIMSIVLQRKEWHTGNPNIGEPDYFCGDIPFEFTLASNTKKKGNYIQKLKSGEYVTKDLETDVLTYIRNAIEKKLEKKYSVKHVHLCVLCLINLTFWVLDEYGASLEDSSASNREELFLWIIKNCISSKKFKNVFLIFPDLNARWWVWDVKTDIKSCVQLLPEHILSKHVPFWMIAQEYDDLLTKSN